MADCEGTGTMIDNTERDEPKYILNVLGAHLTGFWEGEGDFPADDVLDKYDTPEKCETAIEAWSERREAAAVVKELETMQVIDFEQEDDDASSMTLDEYLNDRIKHLTSDRTGGGEEKSDD